MARPLSFVQLEPRLPRHFKTAKLSRLLDVDKVHTMGLLSTFLCWVGEFAADGDLTHLDDEQLADAAGWMDDPSTFTQAMVEAGFLDRVSESQMVVHDWMEHYGKLLDSRRTDADRKRKSRGSPRDVHRTSTGHPPDVTVVSDVEVK